MKKKILLFLLAVILGSTLNAQTLSRTVGKAVAISNIQQEMQNYTQKSGDNFADGFETYPDFNLIFTPWTTVDVDLLPTYGIQDAEFPNQYAPMAFMVFNPSQTTPPTTDLAMQPHQGVKFAACFASDGGPNNDWLISPQTQLGSNSSVSLWVKSYTDAYGLERYKVAVSTTNTNPSSFTTISGPNYLTASAAAWEQKTFDLNAYNGQSVYIGIQCVSDDAFIFMVDDFSITTSSQAGLPTLTTAAASAIGSNTATSGGNVTSDGGAAVISRGLVWSTSQNPTLSNNTGSTSNGSGIGTFTANMTGLTAGTNYFVRAYATNAVGTAYGNQINFTTTGGTTGTGILTGQVTDAFNGNPIEGALVSVAGLSATTNASGNYTIENVPAGVLSAAFNASTTQGDAPLEVNFFDQSTDGANTVTCSKTDYITYVNNQVVIEQGQTLTFNISLSQTLLAGELRFVINWGASPSDLDSHLKTPPINGTSYHIYYSSQGSSTSAPFAALDHDVTTGYGPETMTIYQMFPGTYQYYIYNYSGSPAITTSNCVVQIYNQTGLIQTMQVPTNGTGRYWYVCDINGSTGQLTYKNVIQETAPGSGKDEMPFKKVDPAKSVTSWLWNFGDGSTSTLQNPTKIYSTPGFYTVSLTVSNGITSDTETKTNFIHVVGSGSGTGTLTGMVTDALTGEAVEGALVSVAGLSALTNATGNYSISNVPIGTIVANFIASTTQGLAPLDVTFTDQSTENANTVTCSKTGYITYSNNQVIVPQDGTLNLNISLSTELLGGAMRFVINWGASPSDLDSHLNTPPIEGQSYHVYYSYQGSIATAPYAALDHDVTTGYGPETTTIYTMFPGTYNFYVYNYSGSPAITTSQCVVQIYNATGLIHTLQVPTTGTGRYWHVCDVNGTTGQTTLRNVIQENAPGNTKFDMPEKNVRNVSNITSWLWNFGDGATSTLQNPSHTYTVNGEYTVALTVSDGTNQFTETKAAYVRVGPIGINENNLAALIQLFPVPAGDLLSIQSPEQMIELRISDISGKEVMKQTVNDSNVQLTISHLNQGIYLLYIETIHGKAIKKFTVK